MFRKLWLFALLSLILPSLALAGSQRIRITRASLWQIDLAGDTRVLSREQPVLHGSILVFHRYPDGRLIGLPREGVVAVQRPGSAANVLRVSANVRMARPLAPGDVVDLGETGGGPALNAGRAIGGPELYSPSAVGATATSAADPGRLAIDALVFRGDTPMPGTAGSGPSQFGYGAGGMVLKPTLVNPAANGSASTAAGGSQPINPNGFPATTTTGLESGIQPINPNGFPALTTPPNAGTGRGSNQPRR